MRSLVKGFGSIGQRHYKILQELGCDVAVVSTRDVVAERKYDSLEESAKNFDPEYVVIASKTSEHFDDLQTLEKLCFKGIALCEKPLFHEYIKTQFSFKIFTAYQLRFHELIQDLKQKLKAQKILSANFYVGQHLSSWRPNRDTKDTYSAKKSEGGGVLRDLSHELDLAQFLFGEISNYKYLGGRFGDVTIDSDDTAGLLLQCTNCPLVTMQMNYLDHKPKRQIIVNCKDESYEIDLANYSGDKNLSYINMHQTIISEKYDDLCSFEDGLKINKLIDECENEQRR